MRVAARWRSRVHRIGEQCATWRGEWDVERDLERAVAGGAPFIAGPWLSEVGYEVLYWVPFLRWVAAAYRIPSSRFIVMSRGGTASWYGDLASRYVEVLDYLSVDELASRAGEHGVKQREQTEFDSRIVERVREDLRLGSDVNVLHPSLMFRWLAPFWSGKEPLAFVERHTRYVKVSPPDVEVPLSLPSDYVAVKFYAARSLPDEPAIRSQLRTLQAALAERYTLVQLDTGLRLDDHADVSVSGGSNVLSVRGHVDPRTNLALQTRIIAGARLFVGTCGSLAWLSPLLGVPTVPVFADASFLHAHLHLARRVYGRVEGGQFSPLDLSGMLQAGLAVQRDDVVDAVP